MSENETCKQGTKTTEFWFSSLLDVLWKVCRVRVSPTSVHVSPTCRRTFDSIRSHHARSAHLNRPNYQTAFSGNSVSVKMARESDPHDLSLSPHSKFRAKSFLLERR